MAGTVRFTGTVPSGDSKLSKAASDRTMDAVSVEIQGGKVITLMPFSSINVKEGQVVSEGQVLGTLAASGDASSSGAHVHMGYKSGSTYLDPMLLFGVASDQVSERSWQPSGSIEGELAASGDASGQTPDLPSEGLQLEGVAEQASAAEQSVVEESPQGAPSDAFDSIETGAYELKSRTASATSPIDALKGLLVQLGDACSEQLISFADALGALSKGTGIPLPVFLAVIPVLALSAAIALGVITIRFFVPRICSRIAHLRPASIGASMGAATEK